MEHRVASLFRLDLDRVADVAEPVPCAHLADAGVDAGFQIEVTRELVLGSEIHELVGAE